MKKLYGFCLLICTIYSCQTKPTLFSKYADATTPVVLGKGTLSTDSVQWNNVFIAKTKELYFTKMGKNASVIYKMDFDNDTLLNPKAIQFPSASPHSDVYVNPEGNVMLFSSLMPEHKADTISDWNIWKSIRKNGKWQNPTPFFESNLEGNQFYPWLVNSRNLYFAITPHGSGNSDLFVSEFIEGNYQKPKALVGINSEKLEGDAFVAPDESYIIFASFEREENLGKSDLFISFNENGKWTAPKWMGEKINSEGYDGSPFITEDGQFLIFTSSRGSSDENTFFNHYIMRFDAEKWKKMTVNWLQHGV